jgi:hypothetical protein
VAWTAAILRQYWAAVLDRSYEKTPGLGDAPAKLETA